jgi:hypothetical protein
MMEIMQLVITAASLVAAIGAIAHAWRVTRRERLRSEARVAALAADIGRGEIEVGRPEIAPGAEVRPGLFAGRQDAAARPRLFGVVGAGVLAVSAIISLLVLTSRGEDGDRPRVEAPASPAVTAAAPAVTESAGARESIELIALAHERGANQLTVRGIVRSSTSSPLTAVVLLLDREGALITTAYADVRQSEGTYERRFVVSLPDSDGVGRYRVSFKRDDQVVPHVDRRS